MGISEDVRHLLKNGALSEGFVKKVGKNGENLTFSLIIEGAREGEEAVKEVVDDALTLLGLKIAYLTNFLNPEVVVIGGGIDRGGDYVVNHVRRVVKKLVVEEVGSSVKIILSRLGDDAVALGAVSLVIQELFAEV